MKKARRPLRPAGRSRIGRMGTARLRRVGGVARYYELYELLSGALSDGRIAPGALLPSEPELAATYGLSRTTVRRALERLEAEGRIERRRGSGTYASGLRETQPPRLKLERFFEFLPELARQSSAVVLRFEPVRTPAPIRALHPAIGEQVYELERLRRHAAGPYELGITWIPEQIGRQLEQSMFADKSLLTVLDQQGPHVAVAEQATTAVAADAGAAQHLQVSLGAPLLRFRAVLKDSGGNVRAIHEALIRPDRLRLGASLERIPGMGPTAWRLRGGSGMSGPPESG